MNNLYILLVGVGALPLLVATFWAIGRAAQHQYQNSYPFWDRVHDGFMLSLVFAAIAALLVAAAFACGYLILKAGELLALWQTGWLT